MIPVGSISSSPILPPSIAPVAPSITETGGSAPAAGGFGQMLDRLVSPVEQQQAQADRITQQVLLGDSGQLHQSVIAMQEASLSFSLMVQVRNKLVESYQELMRMQA